MTKRSGKRGPGRRSAGGSDIRRLVIVLGDQLNRDSAAFDDFDVAQDRVWMAEADEESTHVWSHKCRIALFLSAMRHFRDRLTDDGLAVCYRQLDRDASPSLAESLRQDLQSLRPAQVRMVLAGDYRVQQCVEAACQAVGADLEIVLDRHFMRSPAEFADWADRRKQLRMEYFYRQMRKDTGVLMRDGQPAGGRWNYDADNRKSFGRGGPGMLVPPAGFVPDTTTAEVIALVGRRFNGHPGSLDRFDWPVTADQARTALQDFIEHRLPAFGAHQDAMWEQEPWLYHSRLSASLNLKLLSPAEVIDAAVAAHDEGTAPLSAVEGFVRQILGWREFVRGIYWHLMPGYATSNALQAEAPLPRFYWTAETDMACLRWTLGQTLEYGYAHHIQRLMVTGLFALLLGVDPARVHEWYLAVYVDAVEWVEMPNTLGMSQFADGGVLASKPYVASGRYIDRMSNHCRNCRYDPTKAVGEDACPFTTLYWDFLIRHEGRFANHPRAAMQWRNLQRLDDGRRREVRIAADDLRAKLSA